MPKPEPIPVDDEARDAPCVDALRAALRDDYDRLASVLSGMSERDLARLSHVLLYLGASVTRAEAAAYDREIRSAPSPA